MNLYIVDYWVRFPASEYGGLQCVVASNKEECIEILTKHAEEYHSYECRDGYYELAIATRVAEAKVFPLEGRHEPGIVESFTT